MFYRPETNLAITAFWRWWVVHMWVEGAFEFFMVAVVSIALVAMGLLQQGEAERAILFDVFMIMAAGIVGVSHHYWWVGLPDLWVPIGTTLVSNTPQWTFLDGLLPFLEGFTLLFWAAGTWWIPLLVILGVWRHAIGGSLCLTRRRDTIPDTGEWSSRSECIRPVPSRSRRRWGFASSG